VDTKNQLKQAAVDSVKAGKQQRQEMIASTGLDLRKLPPQVVNKALNIVNQLNAGIPYMQFKGKRLTDAEHLISIPIGFSHRMLCRNVPSKGAVPMEVLSHEAYNNRVRDAMCGRI
jgi:hypothetical protein